VDLAQELDPDRGDGSRLGTWREVDRGQLAAAAEDCDKGQRGARAKPPQMSWQDRPHSR